MLDLKYLLYFKTVAEQKSFTRAAEILHIAQPAISMTIKKLEEQLDLTLFLRADRKISLTDEGKRLYLHAQRILQSTDDALLEMQEIKGLLKGEVRVGIPSMLGSYYFPPILMAFRHRHPELNLRVIDGGAGKLQSLLEKGDLDLAVIVDQISSEGLESTTFLREQMMVICPKEHSFANRKTVSPKELFTEELVMFNSGFFHRNVIDRLSAETGIDPRISFETNLIPLIKSIVKQGFAISTLMEMVIQDEPDLVARPFSDPVWLDLSIAWRKDGYLSRANSAFVEFLIEHSEQNCG